MRSMKTLAPVTPSAIAIFFLIAIASSAAYGQPAAAGESVTFTAAVDRALVRNPSALIARDEIERAR